MYRHCADTLCCFFNKMIKNVQKVKRDVQIKMPKNDMFAMIYIQVKDPDKIKLEEKKMKRLKKYMGILLASALTLSLAACGQQAVEQAENGQTEQQGQVESGQAEQATEAKEGSKNLKTVTIAMSGMQSSPTEEGIKQVEDAVNDYLVNELGKDYQVDIYIWDVGSYFSNANMALSAGEDLGVVFTMANTSSLAASGQLAPLNDYLDDELKETYELMGERWFDTCSFNGNIYGVPAYRDIVMDTYLVCRTDILEELNYDLDSVHSLVDFEELLLLVKEKYPDMYGYVPYDQGKLQLLLGKTGTMTGNVDFLGDSYYGETSTGALIGDSTTVENFYASDVFKDYCSLVYRWAQEGLVPPETSVSPDTCAEMLPAGTGFSTLVYTGNSPETVKEQFNSGAYGDYDYSVVKIDSMVIGSSSVGSACGIGAGCSCPESAADLMNEIWTNEYFYNLLCYGIEGVDYVMDENGYAAYPEGVDATNVPYRVAQWGWIIGDLSKLYPSEGLISAEDKKLVTEKMKNVEYAPAFGFSFDASAVTTEVSAVQNVITQYYYGLTNGELDPEEYIPVFVSELEDAGINDIIAAKQEQLDKYFADKQ